METIQTVSKYAIDNEEEFVQKIRRASEIRQAETVKELKRQTAKNKKRVDELDVIIKKLYESYAMEKIPEARFDVLSSDYESEQSELKERISADEKLLAEYSEDTENIGKFIELAQKYTDFTELTTPMINEFIDKIVVHAPEKIDGDRVQQVDIYLKFIGRFELPPTELSPEEEKRQATLKRHRIKSRERYRMIKAGEHKVGEPFKLTCKNCGKTFESKRSNTIFCCAKCCADFNRHEKTKSRERERVCLNCGQTFATSRADKKYCSEICRNSAHIARRRAKRSKEKTE